MKKLKITLLVSCLSFFALLTAEEEKYIVNQIHQAPVDEYFYAIGSDSNLYNPDGFEAPYVDLKGRELKRNGGYIWGMTAAGSDLWYGTCANTTFLAQGQYIKSIEPNLEEDYFVAEFGMSYYRDNFAPWLPDWLGDWRPARIYMRDADGTIIEKTPQNAPAKALLNSTIGIRSAGASDEVVLLAGPSVAGGVNVFAYSVSTGDLLEATTLYSLPEFPEDTLTNIRRMKTINDELYLGFGTEQFGYIAKYAGDTNSPFTFEVVGKIAGEPADMAIHEDTMFCTTWPKLDTALFMPAGLWACGLTEGDLSSDDIAKWSLKFHTLEYFKDSLIGGSLGLGGIASFDGKLVFGTMQVPMLGVALHIGQRLDGQVDPSMVGSEVIETLDNCTRPITIFAYDDGGVEVLYGDTELSVYDEDNEEWGDVSVDGDMQPIFGRAGFGNSNNLYTWTITNFNEELFVGTLDFSLLGSLVIMNPMMEAMMEELAGLPPVVAAGIMQTFNDLNSNNKSGIGGQHGADVFQFSSMSSPAIPLTESGFNNEANYGIRTTAVIADTMYMGTAGPFNLHEAGGWKLLQMTVNENLVPITTIDSITRSVEDIYVRDTVSFTAMTVPAGNNDEIIWSIQWDDEPELIEEMTTFIAPELGYLISMVPGEFTIRATSKSNANVYRDTTIFIGIHEQESLEIISVTGTNEMLVGDNMQLFALSYPSNSSFPLVNWTCMPDSIASINSVLGSVNALDSGMLTVVGGAVTSEASDTFLIRINPVTVDSVCINGEDTIEMGELYVYSYGVFPDNAEYSSIQMSASDDDVAVFESNTGVLFGVDTGSVTLSCIVRGSDVTASKTVVVTYREIDSIYITGARSPVGLGESLSLQADFLPNDIERAMVTWKQIDENSTSTMVTAGDYPFSTSNLGDYTVVALVQTTDTVLSDTVRITVESREPTAFELSVTDNTLNIGQAIQVGYAITPDSLSYMDANIRIECPITTAIYEPSSRMLVPFSAGEVMIIGELESPYDDMKDTLMVDIVLSEITDISIDAVETTMYVGDTETLSATVTPAEGQDMGKLWYSSNPTSVIVNPFTSQIICVAPGVATIAVVSAEDFSVADSVEITVQELITEINAPEAINEEEAQLKIYPNPSETGLFKLESDMDAESKVYIVDLHGCMVTQSTLLTTDVIDLSSAPQGVYLVIVTDGKRTVSEKVVVN